MKASRWSTAASAPTRQVKFTLVEGPDMVCLILIEPQPDGSYARMRIIMTRDEARELAHSLVPEGPKVVPKV